MRVTPRSTASFEFGDVIGPLPLPSGVEVSLQVYVGADQDCVEPAEAPLIDQTVTPTGAAVGLVATAFGNPLVPELLPFPIDLSCVDPGNGGAVAAHAANAPLVDVVNTTLGFSVGEISYGEQIVGQLPAGDYDIEVFVVGGDPEPVAAFTVPVTEGNTTIGYAVGNQPGEGPGTPIVFIPQVIPVSTCEAPPTTAAPTTAPPAATPATAQPAFTG